MTDEEKAKELTIELICGKCTEIKHCKIIGTDKCITYIRSLDAILQGYKKGFAEGRKEKELSYEVEEVTKVELNKCNTIEDKMEWLGKVLGQAIFKNDMSYAVWVNVQKNNIIEHLEKENEQLKEQLQNNPYVQILQNEKSEMAEDFAKQIEKMKCCTNCKHNNYTYWQSHCNNPKVKICKLLMQKEEVICCHYDKWELAE